MVVPFVPSLLLSTFFFYLFFFFSRKVTFAWRDSFHWVIKFLLLRKWKGRRIKKMERNCLKTIVYKFNIIYIMSNKTIEIFQTNVAYHQGAQRSFLSNRIWTFCRWMALYSRILSIQSKWKIARFWTISINIFSQMTNVQKTRTGSIVQLIINLEGDPLANVNDEISDYFSFNTLLRHKRIWKYRQF